MSLTLEAAPTAPAASRPAGAAELPRAMALGCSLALLLTAPQAWAVASRDTFLDPDDAMRAVTVRDLLAGQGWFDLVPHRLSPDHPFVMHWSRLVDLPLAVAELLLRPFLSPDLAERVTRLVEPMVLYAIMLLVLLRLVRSLAGPRALLPAAALSGTSFELLGNFVPGHIHHHGVQVTLLVGATAALLASLSSDQAEAAGSTSARPCPPLPCGEGLGVRVARCEDDPSAGMASAAGPSPPPPLRKEEGSCPSDQSGGSDGRRGGAGAAALAGVLAVVSLGVGLQNLPFVVGLGGAAVAGWVFDRGSARRLSAFGVGLCAAVPVFLLDVPPERYLEATRDAFSVAQLAACLGAAVLCAGLAGLSGRLARPTQRIAAAAFGGSVLVAGLAIWFPAYLGDPMADVDPVLRSQWLSGVGEALPLVRLIALSPRDGLVLAMTLAAGLAATVAATVWAVPAERLRWATLLGLVAIGAVGCLWQVRVAPSTCALALPGLAVVALRVFDAVRRRPGAPALFAAVVAGLFGNGAGWSALASALPMSGGVEAAARGPLAACFEPASFAPLAALPPGLVLSSIDPGSAILASTHHSVLAAPYHRNAYGNRASLLGLAAPPDAAWPIVHASRARYLALCRFSNETAETAALHPDSLSAALLAGRTPAWLTPLAGADDTYLLYRVADSR